MKFTAAVSALCLASAAAFSPAVAPGRVSTWNEIVLSRMTQ
jgi:hypothetical protein